MTTEEALKINGQITRCAMARTAGIGGDPGMPGAPSLAEMLEASAIVSKLNATAQEIYLVCDPRLIAALYVLDNHDPDPDRPVVFDFAIGRGLWVALR